MTCALPRQVPINGTELIARVKSGRQAQDWARIAREVGYAFRIGRTRVMPLLAMRRQLGVDTSRGAGCSEVSTLKCRRPPVVSPSRQVFLGRDL